MTESHKSQSELGERRTNPRYNLAHEHIGSKDIVVRHPTGDPVRIVTYPAARGREALVREALISRGLILGQVLSGVDDDEQQFLVPTSARPIAYDARVDAPGAFSYNDEQLFFDLGGLMAALYQSSDEGSVIEGDVGHAVAFVEFTRPNERQLFFTPGVERITQPLPVGVSPINYYSDSLALTFGARFNLISINFAMGFSDALAEGF